MEQTAPRNFTAGGGWPQQRAARLAARRVFVEAKQNFMQAVAHLADDHGRWLQHQLRQAQEPVDLWMLRSAVFRALDEGPATARLRKVELHRFLDSAFPRSQFSSGFAAL